MNKNTSLPQGYTKVLCLDLQKNKKLAVGLNSMGLLISILMTFLGTSYAPLNICFNDIKSYIFKCIVFIISIFVYIIMHESVHGIFMKVFSGVKADYGITLLYAYAGSKAYFTKAQYVIIALSPIILLGIIIFIINCIVPLSWFWIVYIIQIINISGAVGDIYVTYKMLRMPSDILINDTGVSMDIFSYQK